MRWSCRLPSEISERHDQSKSLIYYNNHEDIVSIYSKLIWEQGFSSTTLYITHHKVQLAQAGLYQVVLKEICACLWKKLIKCVACKASNASMWVPSLSKLWKSLLFSYSPWMAVDKTLSVLPSHLRGKVARPLCLPHAAINVQAAALPYRLNRYLNANSKNSY